MSDEMDGDDGAPAIEKSKSLKIVFLHLGFIYFNDQCRKLKLSVYIKNCNLLSFLTFVLS